MTRRPPSLVAAAAFVALAAVVIATTTAVGGVRAGLLAAGVVTVVAGAATIVVTARGLRRVRRAGRPGGHRSMPGLSEVDTDAVTRALVDADRGGPVALPRPLHAHAIAHARGDLLQTGGALAAWSWPSCSPPRPGPPCTGPAAGSPRSPS